MAAIVPNLHPAVINGNAALLWKLPRGPLIASGDRLERVGPVWSTWLGRIIFWIKDWWTKGEETQKVEALVSVTLNSMLGMMEKQDSHWHFFVNRGKWMGEELTDYVTYDMLADKILARSPFESSKAAARLVKEAFNRINFTQGREGYTKEDVIYHKISGNFFRDWLHEYDDLAGPSIYPNELEHFRVLKHITPEFLRMEIERRVNSN